MKEIIQEILKIPQKDAKGIASVDWKPFLSATSDEGVRLVLQQVIKQCMENVEDPEALIDGISNTVKPWLESEDEDEFCQGLYAWSCVPTKKNVSDLIDRAQISSEKVKIATCTLVGETMDVESRKSVADEMGPVLMDWCKESPPLGTLAGVVLSKCVTSSPELFAKCDVKSLADSLLKDSNGLEGVVHLSEIPFMRDYLVDKVKPLFSQDINKFALFSLLANLSQYPEEESEEQQLRKMAKPDEQWIHPSIPLEPDTPEKARLRCQTLIRSGVMPLFKTIPRLSPAAKPMALKALHNILSDQASSRITRGLAVQQGLLPILLQQQDPFSKQMLCWISMSVDPRHLPVPDLVNRLSDCLKDGGILRFEAMMGLTNFASLDPNSRWGEGIPKKLVDLGVDEEARQMLSSPIALEQRAGIEFLCNMSREPSIYDYYAGPNSTADRLQWIIGLCTVEDLGTRLAASGFLASISDNPLVCQHLAQLNAYRHFIEMCKEGSDLQHRALVLLTLGVENHVLSKDLAKKGLQQIVNRCEVPELKEMAKETLNKL